MRVRVARKVKRGLSRANLGVKTNTTSPIFRVVSLPLRVIQLCFLKYCLMSPP